jgi:hypothetical protein
MSFGFTTRRKLRASKLSRSRIKFKSRSRVISFALLTAKGASSCDNESIPSLRRRAKTQREERSRWFPCLYLTPRRNPVRLTASVASNIKEAKLDICSHRHTIAFCWLFASRRRYSCWYAPASPSSSPKHLVRERYQGSDIFWCSFLRSPISEVSFSQRQLVWPLTMIPL